MKKIGIIILLIVNIIVIPESGIAQNTSVDSLKRLINDQPHDSVKLKANLELSSQVFRFQPDSAIVYASEAKRLAEELEKNEDLGYALKNIGLAYYVKGDFKEVLEYWEESLAIFQSIDNSLGISNLLNNLGAVYYSKGDDPRALENYLESLKIATKLEDKSRIATAHANIGLVYFNNNATHVQAKESYLKALTLAEEINEPDAIGSAANGLGELYLESNDYKDAIFYFEKAFKAFEKTGVQQAFF